MSSPTSAAELKINVGCGPRAADGWLNLDRSPNAWLAQHRVVKRLLGFLGVLPESSRTLPYPPNIRVIDVHRRGIPAADGTAAWVYCSHVLQMMARPQAERLLKDCHRVLRSGGRVRIVTADLRYVAEQWMARTQAYLRGDRASLREFDEPGLAIGDCYIRSLELDLFTRMSTGRLQRVLDYPVQHYYDLESLTLLLRAAGFAAVEESAFCQSNMPDVQRLETHPPALYVEAIKAGATS